MSRYYGGWAPYVPVAERRRSAERAMAKLRKTGQAMAPVTITGRQIATTFWGRAWCDTMESFHDYESRLPRGRSYVRNGSVVDLQIAPGKVTAMVSGSELYNVAVTIKEAAKAQWRAICADCAGGIDSLVELLQGRFSKGVMERLCRQQGGLFPRPSEIRFSCSCPDHASMCKHVAAVLYGVGARLDHKPDLLFRLRAVDETELLAGIDAAVPLSKTGPDAGKVLETDDISALFGLEIAEAEFSVPKEGVPKEGVPVANAAVPGRAAPKRAPAGVLPAKRGSANRAAAGRKSPVKPDVRKRQPAAAKATPAKSSAPRRPAPSKAPSRLASPEASDMHVQGRGRRPAGNGKAAAVRKSEPKPVKWW